MKAKSIGARVLAAVLLSLLVCVGFVFGQQARVNPIDRIVRVEAEPREPPEYDVRNYSNNRGSEEWLEIRVAYETGPEWIDELEFVYYLYFETNFRDQPKMLFKHTVTYQDIEEGRHISKVYLHPNTYERYVDKIVYIGVEIRYKGRPVMWRSDDSKVRDSQWWEQAQKVLSPVTGKILNRNRTPFKFLDLDEYEFIKTSAE